MRPPEAAGGGADFVLALTKRRCEIGGNRSSLTLPSRPGIIGDLSGYPHFRIAPKSRYRARRVVPA
ncbi:hypothetical protein AM571_PA00387 (plasmid) [Rhizobium etli 8C-3]|uniref:Uncharacterized protein n=1 Tax=Rhizobium etli 8C-3 TaxID=538025 RepID=A0A1L5PAU1_RHIET|nr:hypothetical protein AM571_PA00387 [Rhizobium etli 8C-3]